jgi:tripartite-type tricarboxylate transporter receptor subunit TctC
VHVPYKGAAPALQDVIAGHVQMMFATASSVVPHIRDGQVRALAVASLKRTAVLPDIPTIDELGIKNFDATTWHGLVAPAHTPTEVIATQVGFTRLVAHETRNSGKPELRCNPSPREKAW